MDQLGDHYLTADEFARYLKLPLVTVYLYARNGVLPASKLGKHWRFSVNILNEWIGRSSRSEEAHTLRALVIDGDPEMSAALKRWLREANYEARTVTRTEDAIRVVDRETVNLILVDLSSRHFGGVTMLRRIRRLAPDADVAVLAKHPDTKLMDRVLETGPLTVMKKPVQKKHILSLVM